MSLFSGFVGKKEAHVVCDTFAFRGDDTFVGSLPKVEPLIPRNILVAGRGNFEVFHEIVGELRYTNDTLDEICDYLVDTVKGIYTKNYNDVLKPAAEFGGVDLSTLQAALLEIAVIGWSDKYKTFIAFDVNNVDGKWKTIAFNNQFFAAHVPNEDPNVMSANPKLPGDLIKISKIQYKEIANIAAQQNLSQELCGGELLHYRLTRDSCKYSKIYTFPNYRRIYSAE